MKTSDQQGEAARSKVSLIDSIVHDLFSSISFFFQLHEVIIDTQNCNVLKVYNVMI